MKHQTPKPDRVANCRPGRRLARLFVAAVLLGGPMMAQLPVISGTGVVNAAKFTPSDFPASAVVAGSLVTILGANLGSSTPVSATSFPLPTQLGGTDVLINGTAACPLLYVSSQQINCQLPADLSGDRIQLTLRTRDQDQLRISAPVTVSLASANFGFFTMNGNGRGPAVALNQVGSGQYRQNGPIFTAKPGQVMVMYGTGLGATDPLVPAGQPSGGFIPAVNQPLVFVGGVAAQVQYGGRAPGFAGVDQIQFVVPSNAPAGCAVPVRLRVQDRIHNQSVDSNIATIAIHASGSTCVDAVETIAPGSHGTIVMVSGLGHLGSGQSQTSTAVQNNGPGGPGNGAGTGAGPVGFGPHPGIPPHAFGYGFQSGRGNGPDVLVARFVKFSGLADIGVPPAAADSCNVYFQGPRANPDLFLGAAQFLDAGVLTLTTPKSPLTVLPDTVAGLGVLYAEPLPEPLGAGTYNVSGAGGLDVGPFGPVSLSVPSLLGVSTTLSDGATISQSTPLNLAWTGGNSNDLVLIYGRSYKLAATVQPPVADAEQFRSMAFVCSITAGSGQFAVPTYVLQQLPTGQLSLTVTHMPGADRISRFQASGLSLGGVFRWLNTVTYPNLTLGP